MEDKKLLVFSMKEVNGLIACGALIGAGLYMVIDNVVQLCQLDKGTHETQKSFKEGYECGKLKGKIELLDEQCITELEKVKQKLKKTSENITTNETESE